MVTLGTASAHAKEKLAIATMRTSIMLKIRLFIGDTSFLQPDRPDANELFEPGYIKP